MKIAFVFDVCNNLYNVAKALKALNVDVKLYVFKDRGLNTYPESDDPEILVSPPDWIIRKPNFPLYDSVGTHNQDLANELSSYDLVVGSSRFVYFAHLIKTQKLFFVTGSDLTELPFYLNSRNTTKLKAGQIRKFIEALKMSSLARKGILSSHAAMIDDVDVYRNSLKKVGFPKDKILKEGSTLLLDLKKFSRSTVTLQKVDLSGLNKNSVKIFMPSRLLFDQNLSDKVSGQWKGNDIFFDAFKKCVKDLSLSPEQVQFAILDSTMSRDVELAKQYFKNNDLEKHIVWVSKPQRVPFTRDELIEIYSVCDIVADDFGLGWMGSIAVESMATGNFLLTYAEQSIKKYESIPFLSSNNVDQIANELKKCLSDKSHLNQMKMDCLNFVKNNHSLEYGGTFYKKLFEKIIKEY